MDCSEGVPLGQDSSPGIYSWARVASGFHLPGEYRYVWDASGHAAGMYFVRLRVGEERLTEKVVILK